MSDNPLRKCPACGKLKVKRLIGAGAGILFKGSGFYQTDYRTDSYRKDAAKDKSKSTSKNDSSTDQAKSKEPKKESGTDITLVYTTPNLSA